MFGKSRSMVGLDVGSSAVKAVELTERGDGIEVTGFGQVEIPSEDPAARASAVGELIRECGFRTRRVTTGLSGKMVIVRYVTMPRMSDDELKNAIAFEAGKYVPFPLEECVMDCQRVEGADDRAGQGNMTVLFVAVRRAQVTEHLDLLEPAGVSPEAIDVDAFALSNAYALTAKPQALDEKPKSIAFIDVGAQKTCLNIVSGGSPLFAREIYFGGHDFTQAISRRMNVDAPAAEEMKRNPAEDELSPLREAVQATIDDLANEVQLSFDYFENQFERGIDEVRLSGGGSRLDAVRETFERVFERPTLPFNPFESMTLDPAVDADLLACNAGRLAIATGLAARVRRS